MGDLKGIISKLSYISSLNVQGIWITPFFKSPNKDFGYDISDYFNVSEEHGSLDDFKDLVKHAHQLNLKIMIDLAISHSSEECEWFKESRKSRDNEFADWYVWADPKPDGSPPNNWQSIFGGSAWTWEPRRRQYYLHNFLKEQPDFNFHHEPTRRKILEALKYWMDLGIDGIRLDVCNFYFHSIGLEDNPPRPKDEAYTGGSITNSPYQYQLHVFDKDQKDNLNFLEELRALADNYDDIFLMAEIASDNQMEIMKEYSSACRLHSAYSFEFLVDDFNLEKLVSFNHSNFRENLSWSFSNHDVVRIVSRWGDNRNDRFYFKAFSTLLSFLNGTLCYFQGEELGLPEADLPYESLVDPYGLAFYPEFKGRDGCRTPIPWKSNTEDLWLPIPLEHRNLNVEDQESDVDSNLNFFRKILKIRNEKLDLKNNFEILKLGAEVCKLKRGDYVLEINFKKKKLNYSSSSESVIP